jgi:hypothetical protein
MKTSKIVTLSVIGAFVVLILIVLVAFFTISNNEIKLRNEVEAQKKNVEAVFDNTWKIIQQQAGVSDQYKDAFKDIYMGIMEERYDNARGGAVFSWITEQNPNFDTKLYANLQTAIEAQRTNFTREQKKLIDLQREHTTYLQVFPNSIFIGGRSKIKVTVITSAKTEEVYKTSQENDIELFKKSK